MSTLTVGLDWKTRFRIAVLVTLFEAYEELPKQVRPLLLSQIRGEIWCLRNGFDTSSVPELTFSDTPTSALVDYLMQDESKRDRRAALILCTLKHIQ